MIPVRIEMKNFLAYRNPKPVILEGVHLACLVGQNGAGKSSLLDAVTWALWGKARTNRDNDLIHLNTSEMSVILDFLHEGQRYRVARYRKKQGASGQGRLDLFAFDDSGQMIEIREASSTGTQKRIDALLRLDYETFINSAFLQQGQADAFTVKKPAERKQILSNILGLEAWAVYEERAKSEVKTRDTQMKALELGLQEIEEQLRAEPNHRRDLEEAQAAFAVVEEQLNAAEVLLDHVKDAPAEYKVAQEQALFLAQSERERQAEISRLQAAMHKRQAEIDACEDVLRTRTEIQEGYAALQAAREASAELNEKLQKLTQLTQARSTLENELTHARATLEGQCAALQADIRRLEAQVANVANDEILAMQTELDTLELQSHARESLQAQQSTLREESASLEATNKSLRDVMFEIKERQKTLEQVEGADCPLCGQPLTEQHRADMLAALQAEGTQYGDTFRANVERLKVIEGEQVTLKRQLDDYANALKQLPRLQKRLGELQAQAAAASEAQAELTDAQAQLATLETALNTGDYATEIQTQLAELEAQRVALGYDESHHSEQTQRFKTYQVYEEKHTQLLVAEGKLSSLLDAQSNAQETTHAISAQLAALHEQISQHQTHMGVLQQRTVEYEVRRENVATLNTQKSSAQERVTNAQQALKALDAVRERQRNYRQRRDMLAEEMALYNELSVAFGKKGVPAMIIETALPELESIANGLLYRMSGGRMTLRFKTQSEKITGGVKETLDIEIADELGTRSYELYSGGEAFRINFAIRVALSKLLARRVGAHLETLFIDEGFGTQDEEGRARLIEAINTVKDDFDLILVITHLDDLKDQFPVHINITKTSDGSEVSIS